MTEQDRKLAEEALKKYFEPCGIGCTTERQDLQLAITLNPSIDRIIKAMQAYHEAKMKEEKSKKFYDKNTCVVCHQNYVDSANGFDTCGDCLSRI